MFIIKIYKNGTTTGLPQQLGGSRCQGGTVVLKVCKVCHDVCWMVYVRSKAINQTKTELSPETSLGATIFWKSPVAKLISIAFRVTNKR